MGTYVASPQGAINVTIVGLIPGATYEMTPVEVSPPAPPAALKIGLTSDKSGVLIGSTPAGTVAVEFGYSENATVTAAGKATVTLPQGGPFIPPAKYPWVRAAALDSKGAVIGAWTDPRIQTVPAPSPEPVPTPEPTPTPSVFLPGLHFNGWGHEKWKDIATTGVRNVRLPWAEATSAAEYTEAAKYGIRIVSVIHGEGGSIGGISPSAYAKEAVEYHKAHPGTLYHEVLNEPDGSWFWSDPTNYTAYVRLCQVTHEAFATNFPADARPKVAVSYGKASWYAGVSKAGVLPYTDVIVCHSYGGSQGQYGGKLGNRAGIETAHKESGKPIIVTEIGWPTAVGQPSTGDSQQWTESQQAENITGFMHWAKSTGYVELVTIFGYVDGGGNNAYGVERRDRTHKPGFAAITA